MAAAFFWASSPARYLNFSLEITSTSDIFEYDFPGLKEAANALKDKADVEIA
jgi:hypothetical protein